MGSVSTAVPHMIELLVAHFPDIDFTAGPLMPRADKTQEQSCIRVPPDRLLEVMAYLRWDDQCCFEQLSDLTCIDYLNFPKARDRYGITYSLLSVTKGHRLWVKCFVNDPSPVAPSVVSIWKGADWLEREVWDMFGVKFTGHSDLRRILTWEAFEAHPLRKDYPLRGRGEREDFDKVVRDSA